MVHLELQVTFPLDTAFHTTGNRRRWGADRALAMNADGFYIIPATTIKGYLRERAEVLLRTWGHRVCRAPTPATMCGKSDLCMICQVFGNPHYLSPLRFRDAAFAQQNASMIRSGVGLSRSRKAALPQRLFFIETTAPQPARVTAQIEGFFLDTRLAEQAAALIDLASRAGYAVGGGKTRGLGWLVQEQIQVQGSIDGQALDPQIFAKHQQHWAGGRDVVED